MQAYAANELAVKVRQRGPLHGLVEALYQRRELQLEYESLRTRTASEAFEARAGNCLSLVVMTAAFAKALDLEVHYQRVGIEDQWRRVGDLYVASGHVNLAVAQRVRESRAGYSAIQTLTIDFLPPTVLGRMAVHGIEEATIVAMYMNNRAAETLAEGRIDQAYWWAREALLQAPGELAAYNTLAVIYQRRGLVAPAEQLLRLAMAQEPDNTRLLANLASLLRQQGREGEAEVYSRRLAQIEPAPPQRDYRLGLAALQAGDAERARRLLSQEITHWPGQSEVHLAMAQAQLALGHLERAREHLGLARDYSASRGEAALYAAKLARMPVTLTR